MATEIFSYANGGLITVVLEAPSTTSRVVAESPSFVSDKYASFGTPSVYVNTAYTTSSKPTTTILPLATTTTSSATGSRSRSQDINQHQVDPSTLLLSGFHSTSIYTTLTPGATTGTWVRADIGSYTTLGRTLPTTVLLGVTTPAVQPTATLLTTDMFGSPYNVTLYDTPSATYVLVSDGQNSASAATGGSGNGGGSSPPSTATLAGAVGGMLALTVIALVAGLLYWRRRRRIRRAAASELPGVGGGGREKPARSALTRMGSEASSAAAHSLGPAPSYRAATSSGPTTTTHPSIAGWDIDSSDEGHGGSLTSSSAGASRVGGPYGTLPLSSERLTGLETIVESVPSYSRSTLSIASPISPSVTVGFGPNRAEPAAVAASQGRAPPPPHLRRHVTTGARVGRAVENRPEEITPYRLPPVVVRDLAAGSTLPPSLPPRSALVPPPPTYTPVPPRRPASIAPSDGTLNTLTTDDDVFAVDGSSIARTLTTETASSTYTARQRRSISPVAWGADPFADEPRSAATLSGPHMDPFADPAAAQPRPAFRRAPASERSVSTQARTEASFAPGDDTRALHLGSLWRSSVVSSEGSSSSFGNGPPSTGNRTRVIHHLLDDDASSLGGNDNPPPAYTYTSDNTF